MIPKIIHYCWLSGDPYPPLVAKCIDTWKNKLVGYDFILWDRNKIDINSNIWLKETYDNKKYAFSADYIRCFALYHYGGIYLDSDVEVLKSFDSLLGLKSFIGYDSTNAVEAAIVGAERHSEWIMKALNYYDDRHFVDGKGSFDMRPIPRMLHSQLHNTFNFIDSPDKIINLEEVVIFPSDYFSPKNYQTKTLCVTNNTYTIHHFDGKWVTHNKISVLKKGIHSYIYRLFGDRIHAKIVKYIRTMKSVFRSIGG